MKLTADEKTFLDRVCFRLFGNPLKWRSIFKEGLTHQELFKVLVDKTNLKKQQKENHEQSAVQAELDVHASHDETVRGPDERTSS